MIFSAGLSSSAAVLVAVISAVLGVALTTVAQIGQRSIDYRRRHDEQIIAASTELLKIMYQIDAHIKTGHRNETFIAEYSADFDIVYRTLQVRAAVEVADAAHRCKTELKSVVKSTPAEREGERTKMKAARLALINALRARLSKPGIFPALRLV